MSDTSANCGSLVADLRGRSCEELEVLLRGRPDLTLAPCHSIESLARRCASGYSMQAALDRLDVARLGALTAAVMCAPPVSTESISAALGRDSQALAHELWELALLWGGPREWGFPAALRGLLLNPYTGPAVGLIFPRVARYAAEPAMLAEVLATAPTGALRALDDLLRTSLLAKLPRPKRNSPGRVPTALAWLIEQQLVVPVGSDQVAVPAELVSYLYAAKPPHRRIVALDPPRRGCSVQQSQVDEVGAHAATAAVELAAAICQAWSAQPALTVASGGLAVRELKRTAAALAAPVEQVQLLILAASSAGLIGVRDADAPGGRVVLTPTSEFDDWMQLTPATRWAVLAHGWAQMRYRTHMAGGELQVPHVLSADSVDGRVAQWRQLVLGLCRDPSYSPNDSDMSGTAISRDLPAVLDMVSWRQPTVFNDERVDAVRATLREAAWLGVMAMGAVTTAGAALVATSGHAVSFAGLAKRAGPAAVALAPWLAPMVDSVIVQSDLTIVVPGPPNAELAAFLDATAAVESRGVARILRVTPDSLRAAMAAGWSEAEITDAFQRWSTTGVPQPLRVLISDVARTYDQLRCGPASAYLRSDNQALLAQIRADQRLSGLGFFQLAPTVLASRTDHANMMMGLAKHGYRPVLESPEGKVAVLRSRRHEVRSLRSLALWDEPPDGQRIWRVAASLAKSPPATDGDPQPQERPEGLTEPVHVADLEIIQLTIRNALATGQPLRITHVRSDGELCSRVLIPTGLRAGAVQALVAEEPAAAEADPTAAPAEVAATVSVPLMRILQVTPATGQPD